MQLMLIPKMRVHCLSCLAILLALTLCSVIVADDHPDFDKDIVPILVSRCLECHNPTDLKGDLDLTSSTGASLNPSILASGKLEESSLWQQIDQDEMPPGNPLPSQEKEKIKAWIAQGATWGKIDPIDRFAFTTNTRAGVDWWSLRQVVRPSVPKTDTKDRIQNPIDAFIVEKLKSKGLQLAQQADRATLLRRVFLDLIGLPPSPEELEQFLNDSSQDAFEKVVDRLLDSPHYGERWARHWLDVARYTESQGFEYDRFRPNAWHYRDYVIRSFNADKPYNTFVMEQIAGDVAGFQPEGSKVTSDGVIATSLLVCGPWDQAGNSQANVKQRMATREEEMEDLVSVVGQSFLGLTINCARCHAHKFDPVSQEDYYRIKACFDGVKHGERSIESADEEKNRKEQIAKLVAQRDALQQARNRIELEVRASILKKRNNLSTQLTGPSPYARWSFEEGLKDSVGDMHGELHGGAVVRNGRLILDGKGQYAKTATIKKEIREKTLEAWVVISDRQQGGGGVLTLETQNGAIFDSIVYGERQPRKWISGSNGFTRTRDLNAAEESSKIEDLIHMAIVYRKDNSITLYRNGAKYADAYDSGSLAVYPENASYALLGLRHTGAGNGFLNAEIDSASLYDRALSDEEVAESFQAGSEGGPIVRKSEIEANMTSVEKDKYISAAKQIEDLNSQIGVLSKSRVAYVGVRQQPEPTHRLSRGDVSKPEEIVTPAALSRLAEPSGEFGLAADAPEAERRLKLAKWLADTRHPLTSRVMVNRIWHYHFGRGIVETPNDFGFNGARPSHPELLDWLSDEFVRGPKPWSLKHIHRLIVNSATYQQSSRIDPKAVQIDADNSLLWRYSPRRLEGEIVRDCMLSVSGELNPAVGGPSFMPFKITSFNSDFYQPIDPVGPEFNRRTIYRAHINSGKSAMMDSLDCPDPSIKTPARRVTTTPIAALALMNNSFVQRQAKKMAERLGTKENAKEAVEFAYPLCFGRKASPEEHREAQALIEQQGLEAFSWALLNSTEFLYVD